MRELQAGYHAVMVFDDDSIRRMFRTEYSTYERMHRLSRLGISVIFILLSLLAEMPLPAKAVCMLAGCWLFAGRDFYSRVQAERVLEVRNGMQSTVAYTFNRAGIYAEGRKLFGYDEVDRLVEDEDYFYIFKDRQNAAMVPKASVRPAKSEGFRQFLEQKTGRSWREGNGLLLMDRKALAELIRDKAVRWIGK